MRSPRSAASVMDGSRGWTVHLASANETTVRVAFRSRESEPWPVTRLVTELRRQGATPGDERRALGRGRGVPLVASQSLRWRGLDLVVEVLRPVGPDVIAEACMTLPPGDTLCAGDAVDEGSVLDLLDGFAAAVDAIFGAVGDGEALDLVAPETARGWRRLLGRHIGLLVHDDVAPLLGARADASRVLPCSGLTLALR